MAQNTSVCLITRAMAGDADVSCQVHLCDLRPSHTVCESIVQECSATLECLESGLLPWNMQGGHGFM